MQCTCADVDRVSIVATRCFLLSLTKQQLEQAPSFAGKRPKPGQCPYSRLTLAAMKATPCIQGLPDQIKYED